jgi:hypothetical protein
MANSHIVGFPVEAVAASEQEEHDTRFGSSAGMVIDPLRRHSMPAAPATIELPYYARQQNVPQVGVRDSCVLM